MAAMKKNPSFAYFLKNPTVPRADKVKEVIDFIIIATADTASNDYILNQLKGPIKEIDR